MPALNYKKHFAPLVESGVKRCTIRAMRKRRFKVGDRLYHYEGLRTKGCRKLGESDAVTVRPIEILEWLVVTLDGDKLNKRDLRRLAINDGFDNISDFFNFFEKEHGLPSSGQLIEWEGIEK